MDPIIQVAYLYNYIQVVAYNYFIGLMLANVPSSGSSPDIPSKFHDSIAILRKYNKKFETILGLRMPSMMLLSEFLGNHADLR